MSIERTLVLVKPDALEKRIAGLALDRVERLGLELIAARVVKVTPELVARHYPHLKDKPFFPSLVDFMTGKLNPGSHGKILVFAFEGEDAIHLMRHAAGATDPTKAAPDTIRGSMGRIMNGTMENVIHASECAADAEREIALWLQPGDIAK